MRARAVPVQELRGCDATLLEVKLQGVLSLPISQIAPINVMDVLALSEREDAPRAIRTPLANFLARIRREISDIPAGEAWKDFLDGLVELPGHRVPQLFREMFDGVVDKDQLEAKRASEMLEGWNSVEPEPFVIGQKSTYVVKAAAVEKSETASRKRTAGLDEEDEPKPKREKAGPAAPRKPRDIPVDLAKLGWIRKCAMERLADSPENGLADNVLVAGIRFRAKEHYPSLTPVEIIAVLRELENNGQVKHSAGRWRRPTRFS